MGLISLLYLYLALHLPAECLEASQALAALVTQPEDKYEIQRRLVDEVTTGPLATIGRGYCKAVNDNAKSKHSSLQEGVKFSVDELTQTTLRFERFRLDTYLSSGVSPKRYFGLLDGRGKTAEYERRLLEVGNTVTPLINNFAAGLGSRIRVTAKEIIVTFLAEGGALLLTDELENVNRAHPVRHVGLDDYRRGFALYPGLLEKMDQEFGTKLQSISVAAFGRSTLLRPMTFTEAILSTGVMYFYEKELAELKRMQDGRSSIMNLPLEEQFVHSSLVYNSGILFSDERVREILKFETGGYLVDVNQKNAKRRPLLPIREKDKTLTALAQGEQLPRQLTSWNAVYHIVQRYGAWVALDRFFPLF